MLKNFSVLVLSIGLLIYLIFNFKDSSSDSRRYKIAAIIASIVGILSSTVFILEKQFPAYSDIINKILIGPLILLILIFFYLLLPMAWRMRNDPERKTMIYIVFALVVFLIIFLIIVFILALLGFYG